MYRLRVMGTCNCRISSFSRVVREGVHDWLLCESRCVSPAVWSDTEIRYISTPWLGVQACRGGGGPSKQLGIAGADEGWAVDMDSSPRKRS